MIAETGKFRVRLNFSFAATVTLMLCFCDEEIVLTALSASFLHESGHIFLLLLYGCTPLSVTLSAFGICIDRPAHSSLSVKKEIAVSLGGIGFNLLGVLLFSFLGLICKSRAFYLISAVNLLVALTNSLPNINLDAGRALYYFLTVVTAEEKAERLLRFLSVSFALLSAAFWLFYTIFSGFNISLTVVTVYIAILTFKREVEK